MQSCASVRDMIVPGKRAGHAHLGGIAHRIASPRLELELWMADLDVGAGATRDCARLLSTDERARAEQFRYIRDRRRFIVARGALRTLLADYLNVAPASIAFSYAPHGKPFVATDAVPLYFNLSHSAERAIFAISRHYPLGTDIEFLQRDIDWRGLAARFFSPGERAALEKLPAADRQCAFFSCWTRKEAAVKAVGGGLSLPLSKCEVCTSTPANDPVSISMHGKILSVQEVDVGPDCVAAVALQMEAAADATAR